MKEYIFIEADEEVDGMFQIAIKVEGYPKTILEDYTGLELETARKLINEVAESEKINNSQNEIIVKYIS